MTASRQLERRPPLRGSSKHPAGPGLERVAGDAASTGFPVLAPALLEEGCTICFTARGRSMRPCVCDGDRVTVEPMTPPDEPRPGDLLLYRASGGRLALHRALSRAADGTWLCRGDGIVGPEERVPREGVLGRAVALVRRGRQRAVGGWRARRLGLLYARWQGARWFVVRALGAVARAVGHGRRRRGGGQDLG